MKKYMFTKKDLADAIYRLESTSPFAKFPSEKLAYEICDKLKPDPDPPAFGPDYLGEKIAHFRDVSTPKGMMKHPNMTPVGIANMLESFQSDIAGIFDEEIDSWGEAPSFYDDFGRRLKELKHRICGSGEEKDGLPKQPT